MLWMTHIIFALVIYGILGKFSIVPINNWLIFLVCLGAVFPDIDHPKSFIAHLNFWFKLSSRAISVAGHRGPTHTIWAALFSFPISLIILRWLEIGGFVSAGVFFIGYISHLIADSLTVSGVAWFSPLDNHRIKGPVRTGGLLEILLFFTLTIIVLYLFGVSSITQITHL